MKQNCFQFRELYYEQTLGTSMGNPMSPKVAKVFMSRFESTLQELGLLPRFWVRYVDDIFAITKRNKITETLQILNQQYQSLKFTLEMESNNKLSFLDLELTRQDKKIGIAIFHKPTSTSRYITNDSHCPIQYKMASFHSMAHRLVKLPLSLKSYLDEYNHIKESAKVNGYNMEDIDNIIKKHSNKLKKDSLSTLFAQERRNNIESVKRVRVTFAPQVTNRLKTILKPHNMCPVFSVQGKLKDVLGSTKDKSKEVEKSGIYEIQCPECYMKYYGQTKRSLSVRFKEHMSHIRYNRPEKSSVAHHALTKNHLGVNNENLKLVKQVFNPMCLDAYESYFIQKNRQICFNSDDGNIISNLFTFV